MYPGTDPVRLPWKAPVEQVLLYPTSPTFHVPSSSPKSLFSRSQCPILDSCEITLALPYSLRFEPFLSDAPPYLLSFYLTLGYLKQ